MDIIDRLSKLLEADLSTDDRESAKRKIMAFLKDNPTPKDELIHKMSDDLKIDTPVFESIVYEILGSFAGHGKAKEKGFTEKDADPKELKMGIDVEKEHTNWPEMAKRIACDHLAEIPDYYTRLAKMEADAGIKD